MELSEAQIEKLLALLASETVITPSAPQVIKGVRGYITINAPVVCPEMCFRFQENGECVHIKKEPGIKPEIRAAYKQMLEDKKAAKVNAHKSAEKANAQWECVAKDDWKKLPFTYGVYIWLDGQDKMIYVAKATDMRRRHFTWVGTKDKRFDTAVKIWWLHTGWYNEIVEVLQELKNVRITRDVLNEVLIVTRPIEALLPEPPVG